MTEQAFPDTPRRIAAIDLGSNSFHMTLAELGPHGIKTYHREKRKVRLAAGLGEDGKLDQAAIDRALDTLNVFGKILQDFNPDHVRAVGTFTFRAAQNISQLTQAAQALFPYPIEVLSGTAEARLIYQGVSLDQHRENHSLVVDIGGGSTELIVGKGAQAKLLHSCDMGCVSLSERFFPNGEITEAGFNAAVVYSEQQLESIRLRYMELGWKNAIGSSGTIKALTNSAIAAGLSEGALTAEILEKFKYRLLQAGHRERVQWPGLATDRIPTICGGLAILIAVFDLLHIDSLSYSDAALREGLLAETQERLLNHDNRHTSVALLAHRFGCDQAHALKVKKTALSIYDQIAPQWQLDLPLYRHLLDWACQLHEIGHHINHLSCHKHAAYVVQQTDMAGFNDEQQSVLAFLLLSQRKSLKMVQMPELHTLKLNDLLKITLLLRLAIRLNQFRQTETLGSFEIDADHNNHLHIVFQPLWQPRAALFSADLDAEQEQFSPLGLTLDYQFLSM
ncbi:MAG: hypothetical protein ACRBBW_01275 [Cellvibrionaceae bacterium]